MKYEIKLSHQFGIILCFKVIIFCIILFAFKYLPFDSEYYSGYFVGFNDPISLKDAFMAWDAHHYILIAQNGYIVGHFSILMYPLLPFLIFLLDLITKNSIISGLLITNLSSFIAIPFFYKLVRENF